MRFRAYLPKQSVVKFDLVIGPLGFSIVHTEWIPRKRFGGFCSRSGRGFMSSIRIGQTFINLDVW